MRYFTISVLAALVMGCSVPKGLMVNQLEAQNESSLHAFENCVRRYVVVVQLPPPEKSLNPDGVTVVSDQNSQYTLKHMGYYDVTPFAESVLSPTLKAQLTENSRAAVPVNRCTAEAEAFEKSKAAWKEGVDQRNLMLMGILLRR